MTALCATVVLGAASDSHPETRPTDLVMNVEAGWHRRDGLDCRSTAVLTAQSPREMTVVGDTTGVLFWRVPTKTGGSVAFDPLPGWIRKCGRPPLEFGSSLVEKQHVSRQMIKVSEYRHLKWKWRVNRILPRQKAIPFERQVTARLGVNLLTTSGDVREIAYVWADAAPKDSVVVYRTDHLGGIVKRDWHRIVVRSGEDGTGTWVQDRRNIHADFKKLFPADEPGLIIRLYLRTDGDAAGPVTTHFSDITFERHIP